MTRPRIITVPCAGHADLFEATDADSHDCAAAICRTCPVIDWCRQEVAATPLPTGTWAGQLYIENKRARRPVGASTCVICSSEFTGNRSGLRYCSDPCRVKGRRKKWAEYDDRRTGKALPITPKPGPRGRALPEAPRQGRLGRPTLPRKFTDDQCRDGHARYTQGDRSPLTIDQHREYDRLLRRAHRARERAA